MKRSFILTALFISTGLFAQTPCVGGMAGGFPCSNYNLLSRLTLAQMSATGGNDSWGWTDPNDGTEYAIVGLNNGTAFIDISDPINPIYLGKLPTHTTSSIWRDIKVYNNYAFIVSEADNHGMQVFDLTRLRTVSNPPQTFTENAHLGSFGSAHNIAINEDSGFAYVIGTSQANGGPLFINIQNPLNPVLVGTYAGSDYTHDAQIITYDGPDTQHLGKEIFFGSNEDRVVIVDVTNKANPQLLSNISYAGVGYTHQGWLTEDRNYFILGDETDEINFGLITRTIILDVSDLDSPQFYFDYYGNIDATDHNGYVVGNTFYLANYSGGMRAIDISDIDNQSMNEIGYFDTFPANNNAGFDATWNVYPFFASKNIVISGDEGFTLVRDANLDIIDQEGILFSMAPNPAKEFVTITSNKIPIQKIEIYSLLGQKVFENDIPQNNTQTINISSLKTGMYLVSINKSTPLKLVVN
ncbi:MAG: choice-of-anchor B family protein [Flavobacteriaceae bacterium]